MFSIVGHFHPVFVHLPIGILLLAFILQWWQRRKPEAQVGQAINLSLLVGMISAIVSCITGYFLSRSDDYDEDMVNQHQWLGIAVAVLAIVLYYLRVKQQGGRWHWPMMIVLVVLVALTGHVGGSLTHGSDYLTRPFSAIGSGDDTAKQVIITNVQEAAAYAQVVQPVLQEKCFSCHNKNKQKGGFRMDQPDLLLKGGKTGVSIVPGNAETGDLMKRLLLPKEHEDHMPPKEKPQLTEQELALIHWWIASGASFDKKVKDLQQPEAIKSTLLALQGAPKSEAPKLPDAIPAEPVGKANDSALKRIRDLGAVILPVSRNSNYLTVSFMNATGLRNHDLQLILPLKEQLTWVRMGQPVIDDSAMSYLVQCKNIPRLQLDHTGITDAGMAQLKQLTQLQYLNIVGTKVTAQGLQQLKGLTALRSVYCYQTSIRKADMDGLQQALPGVAIDTGGYRVPLLATDTTEVKPANSK
ncbi:c-type cytochrome domain-containing protein [Paraflavitalea pollutisoli]|uniref:c-type cytochrome domain-containing protein n=1 Tax=Paraflavitalea pollutisoli TaxID=3034143 RepID=UPI0023EBD5E6|nr:c-type cytochrome domain-containing protein [Paraflavitalea sp. H1-2-19X]